MWKLTKEQTPAEGVLVETKVQDASGTRNIQKLFYRKNLWWNEDGKTYVYYTPTHWRGIQP